MQSTSVSRVTRVVTVLAAALSMTAPLAAQAAETLNCASLEETDATLVSSGNKITDYFKRIGGGQTALNQHITELANAAGLLRAEDPANFCKKTWELFWLLEQDPRTLTKIAEANTLATLQPKSCSVTVATGAGTPPQNVTATFDAAKAAAKQSAK